MHHPKSDLRDPAELRPHSILATIPVPDKDAPEVCACADAIREQDGHLLPLVIDERGQLLTDDSRLRWMAARRMQLTEVPVLVQPGALAPVIALNALIHRAHLTKSALAYLAVPLLQPAFEAARAARLENLKKGNVSPIAHGVRYGQNMDDLAKAIGICPRLLDSAKQVRKEFETDRKLYTFEVEGGSQDGAEIQQTLKDHFEPKLLRQQVDSEHAQHRPIGLGGVLKAIPSIRKYEKLGGVRPTSEQLDLFTGGLTNRFRYWCDLAPADKAHAREKLRAWVAAMPEEVRDEIVLAARELKKQKAA